jgi:Caspase domain
MRRRIFLSFLALVCLSILASPAFADKRVALVIGNSAYRNTPPLRNPRNDAQDVAAALKRSGFETIVGVDLDKAGMDETAIKFARAARNADVALFYYSGHAIQFAGTNYLVPIDVKLTDEADLRLMTKVDDIVADLQSAKSLRILVLDACRNNPMVEQMQRAAGRQRALSVQRGLARIDGPEGMIVAYATQAGGTAEDGRGRNSPYTEAFLKHIEEPEEIGTIFRRVAADVYETTGRAQIPELSLSLIGEFYLRGRLDINVQSQPPVADPCAAASDHWKSAEAIGTVAAFEDHVVRFPNCPFVGLAKSKIAALTAGPLPDLPAHRFDGTWLAGWECPRSTTDGTPGVTGQFIAEVKDGRFRGQFGEVGKPASMTFNGSINPDGTALISGLGLTGDPKFLVGHPPAGSPQQIIVDAKFENLRGSGTQRGNGRICNYVFDKKGYGLAVAPPSAPMPGPDLRRFDGIWVVKVACESKAPVWPAESYQFTANVKDGIFHAQSGVEGMPRFRSYDGKIQPDGAAEILVRGFTGDTERDPIHRPTGTEYRWKVAGKFEGSHGVGIRADERTCHFDFAMLTMPAATSNAQRFDGLWMTSVVCEDAPPDVRGWSSKFFGRVKNAEFHGETGPEGKTGWNVFSGKIEPDGRVEIRVNGFTSNPKTTLNHAPDGTPFTWRASGRFEETHGSAIRVEGRPCRMDFAKQDDAGSARTAVLAPSPPTSSRRPRGDHLGGILPAEPREQPGAGRTCSALFRACEGNCAAGGGPGCVDRRCVPKRGECLANGCWRGLRFNGCGVTKS